MQKRTHGNHGRGRRAGLPGGLFSGGLVALAGLAGAGLAGAVLAPAPAAACGGFFCSQVPVNQAAEEILFVDHGDGTITTVVEIAYVGPSEKFAWLLPIPGDPDIDVSSGVALSRLARATNPRYELETTVEGTCKDDSHLNPQPPVFFAEAAADGAPRSAAGGGVSVVSSGEVGPYVFHVIALDDSLPEPADAAINWLSDNGYDVPPESGRLLGPYLADGLNLLAVKLTKGNDSGSIRPLMVTYESAKPMIPIKPTAVAAELDMGLQVYVAGQTQAIPLNYKGLVLNEALIDWVGWNNWGSGFGFVGPTWPQDNYYDVVTAAADEAGGQGFVTEFAGAATPFEETIFSPADQQTWDAYQSQSYADGFEAIDAASRRYRTWDGFRDAIRESVTLPMSVSFEDFGRSPDQYRDVVQIDQQRFLELLYERVVKPVMDTQDLLNSQPYLTRLFSTISPEEMTADPVFSYNDDLMDVSNVHTAKQIIECSPDVLAWEAPWRIELPQGGTITGTGYQEPWPIALGDGVPAALRVVDVEEAGGGTVVADNAGMVADMLEEATGLPQDIRSAPMMTPEMMASGGGVPLGSGSTPPEAPAAPVDDMGGAAGAGATPDPTTEPESQPSSASEDDGALCSVARPGGRAALVSAWGLLAAVGLLVTRRRHR